MHYVTKFGKKINRIRKKNWSAPTIMGVFIFTCMIIVYWFEYLGLTNKEKNLDRRISNPENLIKVVSNTMKISKHKDKDESHTEKLGSTYFKFLTQKDKEKHLMDMKNILLEAAEYQYNYENPGSLIQKLVSIYRYNVNINEKEKSKYKNFSDNFFLINNFKCPNDSHSQSVKDDQIFLFDI